MYFPVHNGAMDLSHCKNLLQTYQDEVLPDKETKVIILWGGEEFFSNGIDLNAIHLRYNPTIMAYKNLKALNKIVAAILKTEGKLVIAALRGSASAGGVMLALAADLRYAHFEVVLNPSYINMGLSGSEYWSVLLPTLIGLGNTQRLIYEATPISAREAKQLGLIHNVYEEKQKQFAEIVTTTAEYLANNNIHARLAAKLILNKKLLAESDAQVKLELQKMKDCCNHQEFAQSRSIFVEKQSCKNKLFPENHYPITRPE